MVASAAFLSFQENDLDRAEADVGRGRCTTYLDMVEREAPYAVRFDGVVLGDVTVGRWRYAAAVRSGTADMQTCYTVDLPDAGVRQTEHRAATTEAFPGRGVICQPVGGIRTTVGDRYGCLTVRLDSGAVDDALRTLLDRTPGHPLDPEATVDLRTPAGARWARLVRAVCTAARAHSGLLGNPLVAAPLHDAVVGGLLAAADHRDREGMERRLPSWCPGPVRRAREAMHDRPPFPFTPALLAGTTGMSPRSLHEGFVRHVGMPPMDYLRWVRLEQVCNDLRDGDETTSVPEVARRWGFGDLARFTATYTRTYGRAPGETLRARSVR
jgi:AraC-like DNA-binding protein